MTCVDDSKRLTIAVDSMLAYTDVVAMAVRGVCNATSLSEAAVDRLELCLIEALNNVIIHAYDNQQGHRIEISVLLSPRQISLTVSDWGATMVNASQTLAKGAEVTGLDPKALRANGRGLFIIRTLMDTVSYFSEKGKNSLLMTLSMDVDE
ncbi:MAG: ATP-binding protein [Endozoicomonas sp. (ex Botrylloides leachii)]|nr:ATP-binding protein [Endozoicomonas sp. (ex Botrylloides leachii)]